MEHQPAKNGLSHPIKRRGLTRGAACAATLAVMLAASTGLAQSSADSGRTTAQWNLEKSNKLAIKGYDPVAYFPEGSASGGVAVKGNPSITADYNGATYHFASEANKALFLANPSRYEPAHGGWCSWAMKDGDKVEVDPTKFIVKDNRLFLFYDGFWGDTRAKWLKMDHSTQASAADAKWKKISGESARAVAARQTSDQHGGEQGGAATERVLEVKLDALAAKFAQKASPEALETFEAGIREVASSAVMDTALQVGATAPDFVLPDSQGKMVRLSEMLKDGPVIVTWYRGGWCPYCNLQLREYQAHVEDFKTLGATIVAISPQKPDRSLETSNANNLAFPVLSDADNKVASQYGLTYKLPERVAKALEGRLDLSEYNGSASNELPVTATYVIARDGKIAHAFVDADYRKRAEPSDIMGALRDISSEVKRK